MRAVHLLSLELPDAEIRKQVLHDNTTSAIVPLPETDQDPTLVEFTRKVIAFIFSPFSKVDSKLPILIPDLNTNPVIERTRLETRFTALYPVSVNPRFTSVSLDPINMYVKIIGTMKLAGSKACVSSTKTELVFFYYNETERERFLTLYDLLKKALPTSVTAVQAVEMAPNETTPQPVTAGKKYTPTLRNLFLKSPWVGISTSAAIVLAVSGIALPTVYYVALSAFAAAVGGAAAAMGITAAGSLVVGVVLALLVLHIYVSREARKATRQVSPTETPTLEIPSVSVSIDTSSVVRDIDLIRKIDAARPLSSTAPFVAHLSPTGARTASLSEATIPVGSSTSVVPTAAVAPRGSKHN